MNTEKGEQFYNILEPVSEIVPEAERKWPAIQAALRKLQTGQWLPIECTDPGVLARIRLDFSREYRARKDGNVLYLTRRDSKAEEPLPLKEVEKLAVRHALLWTGGNKNEVARLLGIGKTTLYRMVRKYKL